MSMLRVNWRLLLLPLLVVCFDVSRFGGGVSGLPEIQSNNSVKSFNFQNAHFNARNLWLTFNVLMNGGQLANDVDTKHVLCVANLTFATTCRPLAEGCHSNEIQTPTNGVFATLDLCLNANQTIAVIDLLATYDEALAAIFEQGFVFKSTLTQIEYEQVLVMLANDGTWLGLKLFVSTRRRRDTDPMFVDLLGNMVNSSAIQWAANEPNTTVGTCVIVASSGVAMQPCDEPVDGAIADEYHIGEAPPIPCFIYAELSRVVFTSSGGSNPTANSTVPSGTTIQLSCTHQCGILAPAPATSVCGSNGLLVPALHRDSNICKEPPVLSSGTFCARLYEGLNFSGSSGDLFDGQQACWNVQSNLLGSLDDATQSVKIRQGCTLVVYENADASGANASFTTSLADLGGMNNKISTASCNCEALIDTCSIPTAYPKCRFFFNGNEMLLGGAVVPGDTLSFDCTSDIDELMLSYNESTCQTGGTWSPPLPLYCSIPSGYSGVIHFSDSNGQSYSANDLIAFNRSVVISCDRQCDVPVLLTCQADGNWSPAPPAEGDVCRDPDVLTSGLFCAGLYYWQNYDDQKAVIFSGQRACANVQSYLSQRGINNEVWSISVRLNCQLVAYDYADRTGATLSLTSSLGDLGSFQGLTSIVSCVCPPNYCILDDNNPNLKYVVNGMDPWASPYLQFGGAYQPGTNVTIQCLRCKIDPPTVYVCQSDGTWSPTLPASNVNPCIDPPVTTAPPTCAQVFSDTYYEATSVTMSQEQCFDLADQGLDNTVSSVYVRRNCAMIGYDINPNFGESFVIGEDTRTLVGTAWDGRFKTASCSCPPSPPNCLIEAHPNLRYQYDNAHIILGGVIFPGDNVTIGCALPCDDPGALSTAVYTCQEGGTWSPPLPEATAACTSSTIPTSNPLCARLYSGASYSGNAIDIYKQTCSNLVGFNNLATSLRVAVNCLLTAYDLSPTYGDSMVISTDVTQLSTEWDKRISSVACSCPASPPNCIVDEHPNIVYSYQGSDIAMTAVLPPGSVVKLRCRFLCAQEELLFEASLCRSDGTWSNPLPASNSNICKTFDLVSTGLTCAVLYLHSYYVDRNVIVYNGQKACSNTEAFLNSQNLNNAASSIHVRRNCIFTGYDSSNAESASFELTESSVYVGSYWNDRISRFSCECPSSPPNCRVDDNHPTLRFVFEGSVIVFGGVIPPGGNVTLQCRLPCSNIGSLSTFVSTCQSDGTWLPVLPSPSDYTNVCTEAEPPALTATNVCATMFNDPSFTGTSATLFDGQSACSNVESLIGTINNGASSIRVRKNCAFAGYDLPDATGRSLKLTESVSVLFPTYDDMISTASCFCPASSCFLDDYHPTLRFAVIDDGITVGPAGAVFSVGTNVTARCKAPCASLGDIEGLTFTCQADGSWSPGLPSTTAYTDKCLTEPAPLTSGTVCAMVFNDIIYSGNSLPIYDGQSACANVASFLAGASLSDAISSVHVRHGCTFTAFDMADAADGGLLTLTSSTGQLDYFWHDRISTLSCTCPDIASRCVIEAHPVFRYVIDGVVVEWGASVAVGSNITLTCRSHCNLIGEWFSFSTTCEAGGNLTVPLPASDVIACTGAIPPVTSGPVCAALNPSNYYLHSTIERIYNNQPPCELQTLKNNAWSVRVTPGCVFVGYDFTDLTGPSIQLTKSEPMLPAYSAAPFFGTWGNRISAATCQCQSCFVPASPLVDSIIYANSLLFAGEYVLQGSNATVQCNGLCATASGPTTCPFDGDGNWNPNPLAICQEPAVLQSGQICARLFQQFDYAGSQVDFYAGQQPCINVLSDLLGSLNDNTKSVQVRYGCTLTVFDNAEGTGATQNLTSSAGNLTDFNSLISTASCDCQTPAGSFCEIASNTTVTWKRQADSSDLFLGGVFAVGEVVIYECQSFAILQFTCGISGWTPSPPDESDPEALCSGT